MPHDVYGTISTGDYSVANDAPGAPIEELMSRLIGTISHERHMEMQIAECKAMIEGARKEQRALRDQINKQLAGMGLTLVDGGHADE